MINSYTTMISSIITWCNHDEITTAVASDLLSLGEKRVYSEIRELKEQEATLNVTTTAGVAALPSDFNGLKSVRISSSPDVPLGVKDSEYIYRKYPNRSADSEPKFCAVEASNLIFGPYPDTNYTIKGIYYKRLTALSASNTTNYFTDAGADALFWASLSEAEPFLKNDQRVPLWEAKYRESRSRIMKENKRQHYAGPMRSEAN